MAKGGKPYFFIALIVVVIALIVNAGYLIHNSGGLPNGITGFSVNENILNSYESLPSLGKIFIITEISFLFLILLIILVRDITINRYRKQIIEFHIKKNTDPSKTDIDVLYDALKDKKELGISTISKAFDIDKDTAIEWAQILESGDLAVVEYPGFSEPLVKLNEKEIKIIERKKLDILRDSKIIKEEIKGKKSEKKEKKKKLKETIKKKHTLKKSDTPKKKK